MLATYRAFWTEVSLITWGYLGLLGTACWQPTALLGFNLELLGAVCC